MTSFGNVIGESLLFAMGEGGGVGDRTGGTNRNRANGFVFRFISPTNDALVPSRWPSLIGRRGAPAGQSAIASAVTASPPRSHQLPKASIGTYPVFLFFT